MPVDGMVLHIHIVIRFYNLVLLSSGPVGAVFSVGHRGRGAIGNGVSELQMCPFWFFLIANNDGQTNRWEQTLRP